MKNWLKINPFPLSFACRKPLISYSFNVINKFRIRVLTGITNDNEITNANDDRDYDSDDFKNFYRKLISTTAIKGFESKFTLVRK
jgi:hypothetical protein